ncbi:MAG: OmpA/MotB domain protein [Fibrobacteres bacterium]|nr:OmpA/MotB domain protein [Fibrobacterota bacterium]
MARKHKHPEHVNHERWLVSYADFITLLFATFTALYALSKADQSKAKAVAEGLREAFGVSGAKMVNMEALDINGIPSDKSRLPTGDGNQNAPPAATKEAGKQEFEEIKKQVEEYLMTKGMLDKVSVDQTERGLVVSLKEGGFFESGNADVKESAYKVLEEIAKKITQYRNPVRIEGHTDNVPIHSRTYPTNWELSSARATNMVRILTERFKVPAGKISASGYGESRPKTSNDTPSGRARNRRVDIVILSSTGEQSEPETIMDDNGGP